MKRIKRSFLWIGMMVMVICMMIPASASAVNISKSSVSVRKGASTTVSMQKLPKRARVKWSTSSSRIASVKANGRTVTIRGKKEGIALYSADFDGIARSMRKLGAQVCAVNAHTDISGFDGLILPGGGDIHPSRYGEKKAGSKNINNKLDNMQFAVLDKFVKAGKPVFGVCKGIQVINVYFGGSLNQNIKKHMGVWHYVTKTADSRFFSVYGKRQRVLSYHHQSIKKLGNGLRIIQKAKGGTVEAVEHATLPVYGVQYHPEAMEASGKKILKKFLQVCGE